MIYGAGRALQKFLVALLLPLYTAFLTKADYGILGMVVTVTTFLDVFVTLGFDVAFSRFYFDDKSEAARRRVITNVFYVSTVYPLILLGTVGLLMPRLAPILLGKEYDTGDWRYFAVGARDALLQQPQRPAVHPLPPRAQAVDLHQLHDRPDLRPGAALHRLRGRVRLGAHGRAAAPTSSRRPACRSGLLPTYIRKVDWRWHRQLMKPMLAFAIPALFTGDLVLLAQALGPVLPAALPGQAVVGLYTVAYSLSQPLYLTLHGVPHGVAAVALRQAARAGEAQEAWSSRSSTYFLALNAYHAGADGRFMPW